MSIFTRIYSPRDYSLTGESRAHAEKIGLASAEWYHSDVPRKQMKELMQRRDGPAIRDTVIWLGLLVLTGIGGSVFWSTWACVPFFFVYGLLYGSACDSRWHEAGHGTAFKTPWMNDWVYQIASFMVMRNPTTWRWSHARHHTNTIIVGLDPEIGFMRPPRIVMAALNFIGIPFIFYDLRTLARHAFVGLNEGEKTYIPESERYKAVFWARLHMAIYAATILLAIGLQSWLPLMLIGGPRIYGCWHMYMTGLIQHGGLAEDVVDHRLNSRTVYMNPVSRWLYWNMNYHVEHHMFPMVPYHALPRLHEVIKHDLPAPNPSIYAAYVEMTRALLRQRSDPTHYARKELPATARPYRDEFHEIEVAREGV